MKTCTSFFKEKLVKERRKILINLLSKIITLEISINKEI